MISPAEREALFRCAKVFDRGEAPPRQPELTLKASASCDPDGLKPGQDFDRRGPSLRSLLEPHGWVVAREYDGHQLLRRPGKKAGWSATAGFCKGENGEPLLRVFSSNASPFEDGGSYGPFRVYALLNHGGDFGAAAKQLHREGYGDRVRHEGGGEAAGGDAAEAEPPRPSGYRFCALGSAEFFAADYRARYLVQRCLVEGQPGVCGGVKKGLKTTLLAELTVSLATATDFLGHFKVYRRTPVLFVSAESGEATIQATARRICHARGLDPSSLEGWCWWSFRLPQFASVGQMDVFRQGLTTLAPNGVAVLDPLYLALLAGLDPQAVSAGNLYQVGPLLLRVAQSCLSAGWTPLLAHHATKHKAFEPLDLDDLAFAGIAEFARQWLLLSRRCAYEDGTGSHRLWMRTGGSMGHGGLWGLDVEEGQIGEDEGTGEVRFDFRRWEVTVTPAAELINGERREREDGRRAGEDKKVKDDAVRVLLALDRLVEAGGSAADYWTENRVREAAGISGARMTRAVLALLGERLIERGKAVVWSGTGGKVRQEKDGIRRAGTTDRTDRTSGQSSGQSEWTD